MKTLFILGLFLISSYAISITTCQNITTSGTYILENDLIGANITPIPFRTNGCLIIYADNVVLDGNGFSIVNNATDDAVGIEINASNVEIKNFKNISAYAFAIFGVTGENNSIHNSTILFNQVGSAFYQMNNTNIYNNSIINIIDEGIAIGYSHNFSIHDNYFFNMTKAINATSLGNNTNIFNNRFNYTGYAIAIQNSHSNISYNIIFNSTFGIGIYGDNTLSVTDTTISHNTISSIIEIGIEIQQTQNSVISFNEVSNANAGIYSAFNLFGPFINNNVLHNNNFGNTIESSNLSHINSDHYYANMQDLQITTQSSDIPLIFNATGIIFDNPNGNFQNYTNISINDILNPQSRYFFNWTSQPSTLFIEDRSFNNKYINFSTENETKEIDQIIWHWTPSEEVGYTPINLKNRFYNGTWQNMSGIANIIQHTLTQFNVSFAGVYGIFDNITNGSSNSSLVVIQISPPNNSIIFSNYTNLTFIVIDSNFTQINCSLILNGTLISNLTVTNNTITAFNLSNLNLGVYNWTITCTNGILFASSETWFFTISSGNQGGSYQGSNLMFITYSLILFGLWYLVNKRLGPRFQSYLKWPSLAVIVFFALFNINMIIEFNRYIEVQQHSPNGFIYTDPGTGRSTIMYGAATTDSATVLAHHFSEYSIWVALNTFPSIHA